MQSNFKLNCHKRRRFKGKVLSEDGILELSLALPKELGGKGGATNPEQLFAAGYAACFENAIRHVARSQKISLIETMVTGEVTIGVSIFKCDKRKY